MANNKSYFAVTKVDKKGNQSLEFSGSKNDCLLYTEKKKHGIYLINDVKPIYRVIHGNVGKVTDVTINNKK